MLISQIDYNLIADIVKIKEVVKESVTAVMEERLTASHLASDVYTLLEQLDKLETVWRSTPPTDEASPGEPAQPAQEAPPPDAQQAAEQPALEDK